MPIAIPATQPGPDLSALPHTNSKAPFLEDLRTKGYAVIPSIIPQDRVERYIDDAHSWLEEFGMGYKRDDKATWSEDNLPISNKGGLYNQYSAGHEAWVWRARCEPGVISAFQDLWGTEELIVSFDGVNVTFPYGPHGRTDIEVTPPWPHQDQDPRNRTFQLAQGIIALSESGPEDGGLVVIPGSHLLHTKFFDENGGVDDERIAKAGGKLNSYQFTEEEAAWYRAQGCEEVKVTCPAGSLIIWDSRLIHWNRTPTRSRTRVAVYACYCPASFATPEALDRKAEVYQRRYQTTHREA
ncbi:hypothetical protein JCM24511_04676 [Saitozyma sp. JCM 24511]|nr:hypothetical protein JCM24511_04676 [Saitozyma sp. JCM 24511]